MHGKWIGGMEGEDGVENKEDAIYWNIGIFEHWNL
jgi:hypothetical protein